MQPPLINSNKCEICDRGSIKAIDLKLACQCFGTGTAIYSQLVFEIHYVERSQSIELLYKRFLLTGRQNNKEKSPQWVTSGCFQQSENTSVIPPYNKHQILNFQISLK
ncbi:hypothetical protein A9Q83_09615 [Alphaproteobacteria bacterium 46_93_T64]|nr:hypothetical protein A9Q83_09615 [Alphaproteobacteria bacterium 46_93_T64]